MTIKDIPGEPLRFFVSSESSKVPYLVDLESNGCIGECACRDFTMHRRPLIRDIRRQRDDCRCKHLMAARAYFLDRMLKEIISQTTNKNQGVAALHNSHD